MKEESLNIIQGNSKYSMISRVIQGKPCSLSSTLYYNTQTLLLFRFLSVKTLTEFLHLNSHYCHILSCCFCFSCLSMAKSKLQRKGVDLPTIAESSIAC